MVAKARDRLWRADIAGFDRQPVGIRRRRAVVDGRNLVSPVDSLADQVPPDRATGAEDEHPHNVNVAASGTLTSTSRPASAKARVRLARFWE